MLNRYVRIWLLKWSLYDGRQRQYVLCFRRRMLKWSYLFLNMFWNYYDY
jgi:hypothetical protein